MRFTARIKREDDGSYWAAVNELPGCFASGFSMDELLEDLRGAINLYLQKDAPSAEERPQSKSIQVDEIRVLV